MQRKKTSHGFPTFIKSFYKTHQYEIMGVAAIFAFGLGIHGFWTYDSNCNGFFEAVYMSLQLFTLESGVSCDAPWDSSLNFARYLAVITVGFALIQAVYVFFRRRMRSRKLRRIKNHVVICGLGFKGFHLAKEFLDRGTRVVAIEQDETNRFKLSIEEEDRGHVIRGNALTPGILLKAGVENARDLLAGTENDVTNIGVVNVLEGLPIGRFPPCRVHVVDERLKQMLIDHRLFSESGPIKARMFNQNENAARYVFNRFPPDRSVNVRSTDDPPLHILIVGFGRLAQCLLLQAARSGHYANLKKLIVTIVDAAPRIGDLPLEDRGARFCSLYPGIDEIVDVRFHPDPVERMASDNFHKLEEDAPFAAVYSCMENNAENLNLGKRLRRRIKRRETPIVIRLTPYSGLGGMIEWTGKNIHVVELDLKVCSERAIIRDEEQNDRLAKAFHEDYLRHARDEGWFKPEQERFNPWNTLKRTYREANRRAAEHMLIKLRAIGYDTVGVDPAEEIRMTEEDAQRLARMEKERWTADRRLDGWVYGETRDDARKVHNLLIPWEKLPENEKRKDVDSVRLMKKLVKTSDLKIYKSE